MTAMDQPTYFEINMPRGGLRMVCTRCRGDRVVLVEHQMIDSDGKAGSWTGTKPCETCGGTGRLKFQAPV